jgi:protocatechuate 3,4-dioxygenase beta subunit
MQIMNDEKKEFSAFAGPIEDAEDIELRAILNSWRAPGTPQSLYHRLDTSYHDYMHRTPFHARKPFYWAWRIAAAVGAGILILMAATHLIHRSKVSGIGTPPASATANIPAPPAPTNAPEQAGALETGTLRRLNIRKPAPAYVPLADAKIGGDYQESGYFLTGKVSSEQGEALPGAIVSIHAAKPDFSSPEWPAPVISQTCDSEGQYTIRLGSPMSAFVTIRKEGFAQNYEQIDFISPGSIVRNHRLRPAPACVEGYVFDEKGNPVTDAMVSVGVGGIVMPMPHSRISLVPGRTDASGKYTIRAVPEGRVGVNATAAGCLIEYEWTQAKAGDCSRVDFHLREALVFSFVVKNRRGEILSKAGAGTGNRDESQYGYVEQGILKSAIVPEPGPFDFTVRAEGYKPKTVRADANAPPIEVILDDLEMLEFKGRVVTEWGEPVPGATVTIDQWTVGTDNEGRFSKVISSSAPRINVSKTGYIEQSKIGHVSSNAPTPEMEIRLRRSEGGIYGRVVDAAGKPAERFAIRFSGGSGSYLRGFESDQGLFAVTDIPAGTYDLYIQAVPYAPLESQVMPRFDIKSVEIRKGYFYGELLIQLPPPKK